MKKNINLIIKTLCIIVMFLLIASTNNSYAASNKLQVVVTEDEKFNVNNRSYKGTEKDPVVLSISYDEIIFDFSSGKGNFKFPFYFKLTPDSSGNFIGKYMTNVNYEKRKVTFTKLGATSNATAYSVTPPRKSIGNSYFQAGALYDDNFSNLAGTTFPIYKITSKEISDEIELGNSFIEGGSTAANVAAHPAVFVLCAGNRPGKDLYNFSSGQVRDNAIIIVKNGWNTEQYTISGPQSVFSSSSLDGMLNFNNKVDIVYGFYGSTSEILDTEESDNMIERMITKVGVSIGDVFMTLVKKVCGTNLNIDTILFNAYEPTRADFFNSSSSGTYVGLFRTVINNWYNAFTVWARIILIIVLVGIGIMSILYAGTNNQKKISGMISGWVIAVALLTFGPYFMKYAFKLNDAIVGILANQSQYSIISIYNLDIPDELKETFQNGEDSQQEMIDILMGQKAEITEDLKVQLEELNKKEATLKRINDSFYNEIHSYDHFTFVRDKSGLVNSSSGRAYEYTSALLHMKTINEDAYNKFLENNNLIEVYEGSSPKIEEATRTYGKAYTDIVDFIKTKKEVIDLTNKLSEVNKGIDIATKNIDLMGTMKTRASKTYRFVYLLVWYILIFQLICFLTIYYKRLLMIAVLIIIFPLVAMFYAIEKLIGIEKPASLGTWIKEYLVNVFIQSVHALVYILLVETGLRIYEADSDNWLLFVLAVYAMFLMENIIKNLLSMKASTVRTLGNSAKGLAGAAVTAGLITGARGKYKNISNKYDNKNNKIIDKSNRKDEKSALKAQKRDNKLLEEGYRTGNVEGAQRKIAENQRKDAIKSAKRSAKLQRNLRNNNIKRGMAYGVQAARNAYAKMGAISAGLAGGGDAASFQTGAAVSGVLAGSQRKVDKPKTVKSAPTSSGASGQASNSRGTASSQGGYSGGTASQGGPYGGGPYTPQGGQGYAGAGDSSTNESSNVNPTSQSNTSQETTTENSTQNHTSTLANKFSQTLRTERPELQSKSSNITLTIDDRDDD